WRAIRWVTCWAGCTTAPGSTASTGSTSTICGSGSTPSRSSPRRSSRTLPSSGSSGASSRHGARSAGDGAGKVSAAFGSLDRSTPRSAMMRLVTAVVLCLLCAGYASPQASDASKTLVAFLRGDDEEAAHAAAVLLSRLGESVVPAVAPLVVESDDRTHARA